MTIKEFASIIKNPLDQIRQDDDKFLLLIAGEEVDGEGQCVASLLRPGKNMSLAMIRPLEKSPELLTAMIYAVCDVLDLEPGKIIKLLRENLEEKESSTIPFPVSPNTTRS